MKVKDMIEMLELADKNSEVMLEVRDKNINLIGYLPIGSDWAEYGGYDPDEIYYFEQRKEPLSNAHVELTIRNDNWETLGIEIKWDCYTMTGIWFINCGVHIVINV